MDEGAARCTMHAVVVLCFGCWQGLANRSMRIQDFYVGPVPIPRFIKEYSYSLFGTSGGFVISFSGSYVLCRFIAPCNCDSDERLDCCWSPVVVAVDVVSTVSVVDLLIAVELSEVVSELPVADASRLSWRTL